MFEDFVIDKYKSDGTIIGSGSFADVCKGLNIETGEIVAIKIIKPQFETKSEKHRQQIETEIKIIKSLNHPNIVKCHGVFRHPKNKYLCIVMEFCDGENLEKYIQLKGGKISEFYIKNIMRQLVKGITYLKSNNIIHRDLKPDNLLIKYTHFPNTNKKQFVLKISDFGLSRILSSKYELAQTQCGSRLYMAPEIYLGEKYSYKADLWSVGAILYRAITGKPLFNRLPSIKQFAPHAKIFKPRSITIEISKDCLDLLTKLLQNNPQFRIDWNNFVNHRFLKKSCFEGLDEKKLFDFCIMDLNSDDNDTNYPNILDDDVTGSFITECENNNINLNDDELEQLKIFDIHNSLFLNQSGFFENITPTQELDKSQNDQSLNDKSIDHLAKKIQINYNMILAILKLGKKKHTNSYLDDAYVIYRQALFSIKQILNNIDKIVSKKPSLQTKKVKSIIKEIYNTFSVYIKQLKNIEINVDKNSLDSVIYIIISYTQSYAKKAEISIMFNHYNTSKKKLQFCTECLKYLSKFVVTNMPIKSSKQIKNANIGNIELKKILQNKKLTTILIRKYITSLNSVKSSLL